MNNDQLTIGNKNHPTKHDLKQESVTEAKNSGNPISKVTNPATLSFFSLPPAASKRSLFTPYFLTDQKPSGETVSSPNTPKSILSALKQ